jgi:hypothetical protein
MVSTTITAAAIHRRIDYQRVTRLDASDPVLGAPALGSGDDRDVLDHTCPSGRMEVDPETAAPCENAGPLGYKREAQNKVSE